MGGGKSYFAVEEMLRAAKEGAIIHTNLEIVPEAWTGLCEHDQLVELGDDFAGWVSKIKPGVEGQENLVVVDEGALIFNAQDFATAKAEKKVVFEFMVHSRHLGLDVLFISQHSKNIDAQLRRMAQSIMHCVATKTIKPLGPALAKVFGDFRRHQLDPTGRVEWEKRWARFDPVIGALYRTHMTKGRMGNVQRDVRRQKKEDTSTTALKRSVAVVGGLVLAVIVFIGILVNRAYGVIKPEPPPAAAPPAAAPPPATVETPPLQPGPPADKPSAPSPPRYEARFCAGRDHKGAFFIDLVDGSARVGSVFRDRLVVAIERKGEIYKITLEDGKTIETRPGTRRDSRNPQADQKPQSNFTLPWKNLPPVQSPL